MRSRVPFGVVVLLAGAGLGVAIAGQPDIGTQPVAVRMEDRARRVERTTTTTTEVDGTTDTTASSSSTTIPKDARVRVYNSSSTAGAAGDVTTRLRDRGYKMLPAATGPKDSPGQTRVLYKPGFDAVAAAIGEFLQLPAGRVTALGTERLPSVADTDVMVLVGDDVV